MAPVDLQMVLIDYRGQILENCEFLVAKNEFISIITPKEPSGKFKAIALRTVKHSEKREPLIASDPSDTVQEAIASLHTKSSEAAHLYIVTNGYAEPRELDEVKGDKLDDDDEDEDEDDNTSVVSSDSASSTNAPSVWSATSDTAAEVPTPSSITHAASASTRTTRPAPLPSASKGAKKRAKATNGRKARKAPPAPAVRKTYDDYFTEDDEENAGPPRTKTVHPVRQAVPPPSGAAGHPNAARQQPPPPPSWIMGPPPPPPFRSYGGKLVNNYGPLSQPGPPPPNMSLHPQYVQAHHGMPPTPRRRNINPLWFIDHPRYQVHRHHQGLDQHPLAWAETAGL
ncbi:hypothetical protein PG999_005754 [Apiospora kogelbergensis]|uniref:Uncharacterized protein n=1 Tax=Apiospora kogelbergensis TaxID=1337665 RepID=A0AAW0QPI8_9PEZI